MPSPDAYVAEAKRPELTAVDPVTREEITVDELERRNAVRASDQERRIWDGPEKVAEDELAARNGARRRLQQERSRVPELGAVSMHLYLQLLERVEALEAQLGAGAGCAVMGAAHGIRKDL